MRKMINICVVMLFVVTILFSMSVETNVNVNATTTYKATIDNDDSQGHSNKAVGTWTYVSDTDLYRNDARRIKSTKKSAEYYWIFKKSFEKDSAIYAKASVYINNPYFLDTAAEYYWDDTLVDKKAGTINQKYATKGWNSLPKKKLTYALPDGTQYCSFLYVSPSGTGSNYTGADAVKVTIY